MLISASEMNQIGLEIFQVSSKSNELNAKRFRKYFGSSPLDLAEMWYDLNHTNIPAAWLNTKGWLPKEVKFFLMGNYWLWTYPKNAQVLASTFKICKRNCRGEPVWV